jgi:hypothetical protein
MNELPKIVRARLRPEVAEAHPDADVLTAFYEQALPENEREPVLAHLAQCADCREVVALALPPVQAESVRVHVVSGPATTWGWSGLMRWASVAACVLVVGAAVMMTHKPRTAALHTGQEGDVPVVEKGSAPAAAATSEVAADQVATNRQSDQKLVAPPMPSDARNERVDAERQDAAASASTEKRIASVPAPAMKAQAPVGAPQNDLAAKASPQVMGGAIGGVISMKSRAASGAPVPLEQSRAQQNQVSQNQSVEVSAAAVPVSSGPTPAEVPGRAKPGTAPTNPAAAAQESTSPIYAKTFDKAEQAHPASTSPTLASVPARWTLSPEGQLQRSFDQGQTWDPVPVVERVKFTTLSAVGLDIWVGGAAGVLYHSTDNGLQWTPVKPSAGGVTLTADIAKVQFTDAQHGTVTTSDGQTWTTSDGGRTWQVKP